MDSSGFKHGKSRKKTLNAISAGRVLVNGQALTGKFASKNSQPIKEPTLAAQQQAMIDRAYLEAYTGQTDGTPSQYYSQQGVAASGGQSPQAMSQEQVRLHPGLPVASPHAMNPPQTAPAEGVSTLWIGNMLPGTTDQMMAVQLVRFGELTSCFLMKTLSPKGQMSGFARFASQECARQALDAVLMGNVIVNGSPVSGKFASRNCSELKDDALIAKNKAMLESALIEAFGNGTPPPTAMMSSAAAQTVI